jgi:hypothetical protein
MCVVHASHLVSDSVCDHLACACEVEPPSRDLGLAGVELLLVKKQRIVSDVLATHYLALDLHMPYVCLIILGINERERKREIHTHRFLHTYSCNHSYTHTHTQNAYLSGASVLKQLSLGICQLFRHSVDLHPVFQDL